MEIGKLPNDVLNEIIINTIKPKRNEILIRPEIGEDCTAFDLKDDVCVMSTDPITGATKNLGKIAINVALNDIASCGALPIGIMITIMIPPTGTLEQLKEIMSDINSTCDLMNVDILGGHTEVTDAVTRFVIVSTAVGKVAKENLLRSKNAKADDVILMTKYAGLEGSAIIANEKKELLQDQLSQKEFLEVEDFLESLSVVNDGLTAAKVGVNSMHDITEGGVLGAVWEICKSCNLGATIYKENIPIKEVTRKICAFFDLNPLRLISSGSMLIACAKENKDKLIDALAKENIECSEIGILHKEKSINLIDEGKSYHVDQPESDELYKVYK